VNLRNFWTGEWLSTWKIENGSLTGTITFNAHYFEDGNIQLNKSNEFSAEGVTSPEAFIAKLTEFDSALNQQMT
jgi:capping protein alpha